MGSEKRIKKFNNGNRAILCNGCWVTLKQGSEITEEDWSANSACYCDKCKSLKQSIKVVKPILLYGHEILHQPCVYAKKSNITRKLIESLVQTCVSSNAAGLSAPQIGSNRDVFVTNIHGEQLVFVNAEIVEYSDEKVRAEEGCMSLPNLTGVVERSKTIKVEYLDENFKKQKKEFTEWLARVIQHEYDHNRGILYIDKSERVSNLKTKLKKIKAGKYKPTYKHKVAPAEKNN